MAANQPQWPREWLMTDGRLGSRLWEAVRALPRGSGIVFRHYGMPKEERARLAGQVAAVCRERTLGLAVARDVCLAESLGADLVHNPVGETSILPTSRSAHSLEEAKAAFDAGASLIFLSPIYSTRSHPGRAPLPNDCARRIVAACPIPVIALGGMNRTRFTELEKDGFYGWAGIDAWLGEART